MKNMFFFRYEQDTIFGGILIIMTALLLQPPLATTGNSLPHKESLHCYIIIIIIIQFRYFLMTQAIILRILMFILDFFLLRCIMMNKWLFPPLPAPPQNNGQGNQKMRIIIMQITMMLNFGAENSSFLTHYSIPYCSNTITHPKPTSWLSMLH